jgi:hypothetical protein
VPAFSAAGLARSWWGRYLVLLAWSGVILAVSLGFSALAR